MDKNKKQELSKKYTQYCKTILYSGDMITEVKISKDLNWRLLLEPVFRSSVISMRITRHLNDGHFVCHLIIGQTICYSNGFKQSPWF